MSKRAPAECLGGGLEVRLEVLELAGSLFAWLFAQLEQVHIPLPKKVNVKKEQIMDGVLSVH